MTDTYGHTAIHSAVDEFHARHPEPTTVEGILDQAIEALDELGWVQGTLMSDEGVCAMGAIEVASHDKYSIRASLGEKALIATVDAVKDHLNLSWASLPEYNDRPGTTVEDIKLMFKHARHKLESK